MRRKLEERQGDYHYCQSERHHDRTKNYHARQLLKMKVPPMRFTDKNQSLLYFCNKMCRDYIVELNKRIIYG